MKKSLAAIAVIFFLFGCAAQAPPINKLNETQATELLENILCINSHCIEIERAVTPQQQSRGLMFRESLCNECGMLFVFGGETMQGFWMKNTLIPLDMIWINAEKKIIGITTAVPCTANPCTVYNSPAPAKYVLEVNAGFAQAKGIKAGDTAEFE